MRGYKRLVGRQLSVVSDGSSVTLANVNMNIKRKVGDKLAEALEKIKLNVRICGNEEYFSKVIEEIVNEALEGEE